MDINIRLVKSLAACSIYVGLYLGAGLVDTAAIPCLYVHYRRCSGIFRGVSLYAKTLQSYTMLIFADFMNEI